MLLIFLLAGSFGVCDRTGLKSIFFKFETHPICRELLTLTTETQLSVVVNLVM